ncbi:helix-turn-helix domain-containing protein [Shouchella sp. JSM 1781072]|uniref:helix-turn-helix domain-containing protein n=1 Tax=Bacillaceae TaxID=186817 RepID=UPI0020D1DBBE|nr:helix-turn-helix domain-containing protein [Alkalihalobacillus sp. LMS6]UTR07800.1 helix-turn-helix domain-containing protein [Alkalihalobacillus sp. LMS6]
MNAIIKETFSHALWQPTDELAHRLAFQSQQEMIYMHRLKLTEREKTLLSLLLSEPDDIPKPLTKHEQEWYTYIYRDGPQPQLDRSLTGLHFYVEQPIVEIEAFREAVLSFFPSQTLLLWESERTGVLLFPSDYHDYDLDAIIELIESDFYTTIRTFLGVPLRASHMRSSLSFERDLFTKRIELKKGPHTFDVATSSLIEIKNHIDPDRFQQLRFHFFSNELLQDRELIHTVTTFLKQNLNTSQTAKELHLHRNSLQYRLDKFSAQTGLDLRLFTHATLTFLLLKQPH